MGKGDGELKIENGKWKMGDGKWGIENGKWKMESGKWKVGNGVLGCWGQGCFFAVNRVGVWRGATAPWLFE
jgi:hypothetical protein